MTSAKRQKRLLVIKVFALLSIIRWLNIGLTLCAQYLAAVFVLNPTKNYIEILSNPKLHLMTLASAFIIAAGYILNSFYDLEKDLVNRPNKTLFGRIVSRSFCLNCYFAFNTIGLILAISASWRIFIYYLIFAIGLWAYSHKFQKIPVLREIMASILSVTSFFSIGIFYKYLTFPLFIYGCFAMFIIFARELVKDLEANRGNTIYGYGTMATWLGKNNLIKGIMALNFLSIIPLLVLLIWGKLFVLSLSLIALCLILNLIIYTKLYHFDTDKNVSLIHDFYKFYLVVIIGLVVLVQ